MEANGSTKSSLNATERRRRMVQNYLLIWVDGSIDLGNEDCKNTLAQLRSVVREVCLCSTPAQCMECLNNMHGEKAFVISSGASGQYIVPAIHEMTCVDAIYIFCGNKTRHEVWTKEWPKIQGVFTSIEPICESLQKVAYRCDHDTIPMSFIPKTMMVAAVTSGQNNLNQLPPSFIYSMLFKEITLEINEHDNKPLNDFILYCRKTDISTGQLEDLRLHYRKRSPIEWYTCHTFLYSMVNHALRVLDMKVMSKLGFFIRNLHLQLEQLHKEQSRTCTQTFVVFRGQGFTQEDFQQLLDTKGGLLSFNSFLSASLDREVAMGFAKDSMKNHKENVGVLFIMSINPSRALASGATFASIVQYSAHPSEKEILFSTLTVFCVEKITQTLNNIRLWEVQLSLTDKSDPQLAAVIHYMREEIDGDGLFRLGKLMIRMAHFDQAEGLYNDLLSTSSSDANRAHIYHQLGLVKYHQGQHKHALALYEKSLQIREKILVSNDPLLAESYNNIGLVYNSICNYSKALSFYEKSLKIRKIALPSIHSDLASSYNNIGVVHYNIGDHAAALEFYKRANEIWVKALPPNHPLLATSYNNEGAVYNRLGDYSSALESYKKAHEIKEKTLTDKHPDLARSFNNIATTHDRMGNYLEASRYYERAVEIAQHLLTSDHSDLELYKQALQDIRKKL